MGIESYGGIIILVVFTVISVTGLLILHSIKEANATKDNEDIQEHMNSGTFLYYTDMMDKWVIDSKYKSGYHYNDTPGCYVILLFDEMPNEDFTNYANSYVGQSQHVCKRLHDHFKGSSGKGKIFADIEKGRKVYFKFVRCSKEDLDRVEARLIALYHGPRQYNLTKGNHVNSYYSKSINFDTVEEQQPVKSSKKTSSGVSDGVNDSGVLFVLASAYENGNEVMVDYDKAFELYKESAALGNDRAKFKMALMYRDGKGCKKNLEEAKRLLLYLSTRGFEGAKEELDKVLNSLSE